MNQITLKVIIIKVTHKRWKISLKVPFKQAQRPKFLSNCPTSKSFSANFPYILQTFFTKSRQFHAKKWQKSNKSSFPLQTYVITSSCSLPSTTNQPKCISNFSPFEHPRNRKYARKTTLLQEKLSFAALNPLT